MRLSGALGLAIALASCRAAVPAAGSAKPAKVVKVERSPGEWRRLLSPEQHYVLRERGTESAFTGLLHANREPGVYHCAGCGRPLFRSEDKFDSSTGWPSFSAPIAPGAVETRPDEAFAFRGTEVLCPACGGHLGHLFEDGPPPSGLRYCINSAALRFELQPR